MRYFDSHAHYWDDAFQQNGETADELIDSLLSECVSGMINVGTSPGTSRIASLQAIRHPGMVAAAGIHPTDAQSLTVPMEEALADIETLLDDRASKCVAIGEIGLDYHYDDTDRALQISYFEAQLLLSERRNLPVIIHDRDAHGDIFEILLRHPHAFGVLHSFSGSPELAREFTKRGWYLSFSGTISFKNAGKVAEAARIVPENQLLIETDSPYLTPHPFRGKRNHSGYLRYTNEALAAIRNISPEDCAALTERNARQLFSLPGP